MVLWTAATCPVRAALPEFACLIGRLLGPTVAARADEWNQETECARWNNQGINLLPDVGEPVYDYMVDGDALRAIYRC